MKTNLRKRLIATVLIPFTFLMPVSLSVFASTIETDALELAAKNGVIDVQVSGQTVILTGFVENHQSRLLAESLAKQEGFEVINQLMVPAAGGVGFF